MDNRSVNSEIRAKFQDPTPSPTPTLRKDVINLWLHTGKDLKKESEWRDYRLQWLNLFSLSATHYFDSFDKVKNIRDKNKGQDILYDRRDAF